MKNVGLLLIATGKYDTFVAPLLESAERWFLREHRVTYFLFTDSARDFARFNIMKIFTQHRPWPYTTLMRYENFITHSTQLSNMDYLFYCDIDMLFVGDVGQNILGKRVGTQHPGYYGRRGTPETRKESTAYIGPNETIQYFAGGFNGGSSQEFLRMAHTINTNIKHDLDKSIIAVWHDESHLNRYFVNHPPTVVLDPGYCYGESMRLPFKKRILALDKDHAHLRS